MMASFTQDCEASIKEYKDKLATLKNDLHQTKLSKEELSTILHALKEENEVI